MAITPPDIVGAMRKMGWSVASRLMDRWAKGGAWTMSSAIKSGSVHAITLPASQVDQSIVTMSWAKSFSASKASYSDLAANALSVAGQNQLKARLRAAGWTKGAFTFGARTLDAVQLDARNAINYRGFGSLSNTIDDMYGALGNAGFKAAAVGRVEVRGKRDVFVVDAIGIYVRDTYDFLDSGRVSQPLGVWNEERCLNKAEMSMFYGTLPGTVGYALAGFESVDNATFNRWRTSSGRGGDFVIYSDVEWIRPTIAEIPL